MAGLLAAIAGVLGFGLSRTDRAHEKREQKIRDIAQKVFDAGEKEERITVRLNTVEVRLDGIKEGVDELKASVGSTNEKLDTLLLSGRLQIRKDE